MAIQQGSFNFTQKFGNAVGRKGRGGSWIASLYQKKIKNPNTVLQQQTRAKFKLLVSFASVTGNFTRIGMKNAGNQGETWLNAFTRLNFADGITGTFPAYALNFSKLLVSKGSLDNPYNTTAQVQGTDLSFSWTDNSGIGNALETDKAMFIAYNSVKKQAIVVTDAADRSTRQASYSLPTAWVSDSIEVYFCMRRAGNAQGLSAPNKDDCSSSLYLGSFNL